MMPGRRKVQEATSSCSWKMMASGSCKIWQQCISHRYDHHEIMFPSMCMNQYEVIHVAEDLNGLVREITAK